MIILTSHRYDAFSVIVLSELNIERCSRGKPGDILVKGGVKSVNASALDIIVCLGFELSQVVTNIFFIYFKLATSVGL